MINDTMTFAKRVLAFDALTCAVMGALMLATTAALSHLFRLPGLLLQGPG